MFGIEKVYNVDELEVYVHEKARIYCSWMKVLHLFYKRFSANCLFSEN